MVVMMFMKWILYGPYNTDDLYGTSCAPSVLIFFINMMLFKNQKPPENCKEFMFAEQETLQRVLVVMSLLCIPVMLFGKPTYIFLTRKKNKLLVSLANKRQ